LGENKLLFSKHLRLLLHPNGMLLPEIGKIEFEVELEITTVNRHSNPHFFLFLF